MIILTLAEDTVIFVFLDFIKGYKSITSLVLNRLSKDSVLIVTTKGVHEDVGLGRSHMYSTLALFDFAALNLRVVALGYFKARSQHTCHCDSLDDLFSTFTLEVDTHDLAVLNVGVLDLYGVVGVGEAVDGAGLKI